jgi:hypothetical protein
MQLATKNISARAAAAARALPCAPPTGRAPRRVRRANSGDAHARRRAPARLAALDGGAGGGWGGSGASGPGGDSDNDDDDVAGGGPWATLAAFAAAVAAGFALYSKLSGGGAPTAAAAAGGGGGEADPLAGLDFDETRTLKRLLREAFADLVQTRARLEELERLAGVDPAGDGPSGVSALRRAAPRPAGGGGAPGGAARSALSGALLSGGGFLWGEDGAGSGALDAVAAAGVRLGTDLTLRLGGPVRGGRDALAAEVRLEPGGGDAEGGGGGGGGAKLRRLVYAARAGGGVRLVAAPFGARGADAAFTLNPAAGRGLAAGVRHGSPLHRRRLGALAGAALDLPCAWLSAAAFSGEGDAGAVGGGPPALLPGGASAAAGGGLFLQAAAAPTPELSLGLAALAPRGTSASAAWAALGRRLGAGVGAAAAPAAAGPAAGPVVELAATAALSLPAGLALHGWACSAAAPAPAAAAEWGATLLPRPAGPGAAGWALSAARSLAVDSAEPAGGAAPRAGLAPNIFELSAQLDLGDGLLLTPGVVALRRRGRTALFAGVKTAWLF